MDGIIFKECTCNSHREKLDAAVQNTNKRASEEEEARQHGSATIRARMQALVGVLLARNLRIDMRGHEG